MLAMRLIVLALLTALASGPVAAAGCERSNVPPPGARSLWYCNTDTDTAIVFVHGLNSDSRQAWLRGATRPADNPSYWPQIVAQDTLLQRPAGSGDTPAVFLAGYFSGVGSTDFDMAQAADRLFASLTEPLDGNPAVLDKRNLLFVAHSLGGVLVRDVLVRYANAFAGKRLGVLLVASPSRGSKYAKSLVPGWLARSQLIEQLAKDSDYLEMLRKRFDEARQAGGKLQHLVGRELYEHRIVSGETETGPDWFRQLREYVIETAAEWTLRERVVEKDSAAAHFDEAVLIEQSNHFTIAAPKSSGSPQHRELRRIYREMLDAGTTACLPPARFRVQFAIESTLPPEPLPAGLSRAEKDRLPLYELEQLSGTGDSIRRADVERDPRTGFHVLPISDPPFVCPGEAFWAQLTRKPAISHLIGVVEAAGMPRTIACFRRPRQTTDRQYALLRCNEGGHCSVDPELPGLAEACEQSSIIPIQYRDSRPQRPTSRRSYWSARSLQTLDRLPEAQQVGFTEFSVESGPVLETSGATHFDYFVSVNGVEVYMDGRQPVRQAYNYKDGIRLDFALENLGFNGGIDGHEEISVELNFYRGRSLLKSVRISRPYVSYRHAKALTVKDGEGSGAYEWRGYYRPGRVQASYEVMLDYGSAEWVKERRAAFDAAGQEFKGQRAVGVIRPGRDENPTFGMIIGLAQPSGQIKSLFTRPEVDALCRWIRSSPGFDDVQKEYSYIFEFPAETFTRLLDRGRIAARCRVV